MKLTDRIAFFTLSAPQGSTISALMGDVRKNNFKRFKTDTV